ncbi:MAG: hypothetical protein AB7I38_15185 [Dehalococcoidia bacterium]
MRGPGARSAAEALRAFLGPLRRSLSCVTDAVLVGGGRGPAPALQTAALQGGVPVPLVGQDRLLLRVAIGYRLVRDGDAWVAEVGSYVVGLDRAGAGELVAYHWHPDALSPVRWPHLHVGAGSGARAPVLGAHLPTGTVGLPVVVRMAIMELGARPRRDDWEVVLAAAEAELAI